MLSTDDQRFYYGNLQVEALDVTHNMVVFSKPIYAATATYAFGSDAYYNAATGVQLGSLGFTTTVYALSADGNQLWAFNPADTTLHEYALPEPSTLGLSISGALGLAILAMRKRRRADRF